MKLITLFLVMIIVGCATKEVKNIPTNNPQLITRESIDKSYLNFMDSVHNTNYIEIDLSSYSPLTEIEKRFSLTYVRLKNGDIEMTASYGVTPWVMRKNSVGVVEKIRLNSYGRHYQYVFRRLENNFHLISKQIYDSWE